ncbi:hypothetical protein NVP1021C_46 [Vibrio phage 1.021.C._10N.222.51.F9]|nr:hypothetical protein NVP1021A_46 [Vibrio phage 1.021.A._10N.222.51.F9]AUR82159.1 hypothetical protein NVP1021B_46 [Vibrio phage 1.021.B._10N.222.51.F9]AUR82209.1 hypothetical protein NVP1021C_46 [Vibrio phage 1.021.C._10N.222.51.F9]
MIKNLRCKLGLCKNVHCEIHVTAKLPAKGKQFRSAIIYRCDDCGKVKKITRSFDSFFIIPEQFKSDEVSS